MQRWLFKKLSISHYWRNFLRARGFRFLSLPSRLRNLRHNLRLVPVERRIYPSLEACVAVRAKYALRGSAKLKTDVYVELYLCNKNFDSLIRVLQRIEALGICPSQLLKAHETRLQQLRAVLSSDLLEAMLTQEQADEARFQQLVALMCASATEMNHLH